MNFNFVIAGLIWLALGILYLSIFGALIDLTFIFFMALVGGGFILRGNLRGDYDR